MTRSPKRSARPAIPPATPPAIAAAFEDLLVDSGTGGIVGSAVWPPTISVDTLLSTEVGVADVMKLDKLLVEEGLMLEYDVLVDA